MSNLRLKIRKRRLKFQIYDAKFELYDMNLLATL